MNGAAHLRECVNTEFVWELKKRDVVKAAEAQLNRARGIQTGACERSQSRACCSLARVLLAFSPSD